MPYRSMLNQDEGDLFTGTRICRECGQRFPMERFHWAIKNKIRVRKCKACVHARTSELRDFHQQRTAFWNFSRNIRKKYGLTVEEWERLLSSQGGICPICSKILSRDNAHVDHDHVTDQIRGILCFECNTGIGKFHDSIEWLQKAIDYLKRSYPSVNLRSRELTGEELRQIRSQSAKTWYDSEAGQISTRRRSQRFQGQNNSSAKISDSTAAEIAQRYKAGGITQHQLALDYGVSQGLVSAIILGKVRTVNGIIRRIDYKLGKDK